MKYLLPLLLLALVASALFVVSNADQTTISPKDAYSMLVNSYDNTFLVDVRTDAEWKWVGTPVIPRNNSHLIFESFLVFPDMHLNADFIDNVYGKLKRNQEFDPDRSHVIFMCCCAGRSMRAAQTMSSLIKNTYSMLYGFAGDLDTKSHRMSVNGWVFDQLPWVQS